LRYERLLWLRENRCVVTAWEAVILSATPTPSAPPSAHLTPAHAAHAVRLNLDQWLTIVVSVAFGVSGVIFGLFGRRDARAARRRAEDQQQRAEKTDVYRQLHLLALHRFGIRAYDVRQRYRLAGPDGTPIDPVPPEPPLTAREVQALDFDAPRVASAAVLAAVKHAQEAQNAWQEAVREYVQTADLNRTNQQAGNFAATTSQHMTDLISRRDKAAEAADQFDAALIEVLRAETSLG